MVYWIFKNLIIGFELQKNQKYPWGNTYFKLFFWEYKNTPNIYLYTTSKRWHWKCKFQEEKRGTRTKLRPLTRSKATASDSLCSRKSCGGSAQRCRAFNDLHSIFIFPDYVRKKWHYEVTTMSSAHCSIANGAKKQGCLQYGCSGCIFGHQIHVCWDTTISICCFKYCLRI